MLSVAKLTPGQEAYYERSVAVGLDDYYAGRGESPGVWAGRGAAELGLEGVVQAGQLGLLVRGLNPLTEERLRTHPKPRTITVERIDPYSGARHLHQKRLAPVAGFDLVFSTPKSVSLLHALGDEGTRRAINEAHLAAWHAAIGYLEDEGCVTRRGKGGVFREHGGGFVAAAYQHRTSRAQDPHLHTHVIVANMAQSPSDSNWRALDGEPVLKNYRLAAGYLYESHLRYELSRSLGVEWDRPAKGWAELRRIPRRVIDEFSQRRRQVAERLQGVGDGFYAAQVAALDTREKKEQLDLDQLREDWWARAAEHGLGRRELNRLLNRTTQVGIDSSQLQRIATHMLGPTGLTEKQTAFSEPELAMAWAQAHTSGAPVDRIRKLSTRLLMTDGVKQVGEDSSPGRPARYSTAELISVEEAALALVEAGHEHDVPRVTPDAVDAVIANRPFPLSPDQEAMLRTCAESDALVVCVIGLAGAGKTTAVHALAQAFAAEGTPVLGAAPAGVAAEKLRDEAGIPATTLHRLLDDASRDGLPEGCLLVVDEASMAETRILAPVLARVRDAGGKAVLVGDPHQLPAVGAGGLFTAIAERHGAVELTENRRQHDEVEREALAAIRRGFGRDYLAFSEAHDRLVVADDPLTLRTRLLADWWNVARNDPAGNIMIALRRRDVAELNALGRALMDSDGRLGRERLIVAGREFASGDRVVCRRNSDLLSVTNGTRGTVDGVENDNGTVSVRTDRGDSVKLPASYLEAGYLQHAYALTGHAGQGVTVERAFVLGSAEARLQEWAYVALSRARTSSRLYVTAEVRERESEFHDLDDRDSVSRLAQSLEESAIERIALDQHPLPVGPMHETRAEIERTVPSQADRERIRLIQQQRVATTKLRDQAQEKVARAERSLAELGRLGTRARRSELEAEIVRLRLTVERAEQRLNEGDRLQFDQRLARREKVSTLTRETVSQRTVARQSLEL